MTHLSVLGRLGIWGALAALLLGGLALIAWGRPGARAPLDIAPPTGLAPSAPPLDEQVPDDLQTATFSLG